MSGPPKPLNAPRVCLSCKTNKRKCDKLLPTCSTCKNFHRICVYEGTSSSSASPNSSGSENWYPHVGAPQTASSAGVPLVVLPTRSFADRHTSHNRLSHLLKRDVTVCERCRNQKRKCDRGLPSCSRCRKYGIRCIYNVGNQGSHGPQPAAQRSAASSDGRLTPYPFTSDSTFLRMLDLSRVDPRIPYPVAFRAYMPLLVNHFCATIAIQSDAVNSKSLAFHMRTTWIGQALTDPCLFHSTLFAASAHRDILQGISNNVVTLFHETETIRLLSLRLQQPQAELDYITMASILPLVYFDSIRSTPQWCQAHKKALLQIVRARGGLEKLDIMWFRGLITKILLSDAICLDTDPILPVMKVPSNVLPSWEHLSTLPPTGLLSAALRRASTRSHLRGLTNPTLAIIEHVHAATSLLACQVSTDDLTGLGPIPESPFLSPSRMGSLIHESCRLASMIFWNIVNKEISSRPTTPLELNILQGLLWDLRCVVAKTDPISWLEAAPEACQWVCFTGAAASLRDDQRTWFVIFQATVEAAIDTEEVTTLKNGLGYFRWLRKLYLNNYSRTEYLPD